MNNNKTFKDYIYSLNINYDTVVSIGNFDGFHIGHNKLIDRVIEISNEYNLKSIIFSYEEHPQNLISGLNMKLITENNEKRNLLYSKGLDFVFFVPFDESLKSMSAYEFCDNILIKKLRTKVLVLGEDARFGSERLIAKKIKEYLESKGVEVYLEPLLIMDESRVSSSLIRELIEDGNIKKANEYLGRKFKIYGKVIHGKKRGSSELGFPTANLEIPKNQILPSKGVYNTVVKYEGTYYKGATNIGQNPTFGTNDLTIETYIIDFDKIIYGENLEIEFIEKLRDEIKFNNKEELIYQMKKDVEKIVNKIE